MTKERVPQTASGQRREGAAHKLEHNSTGAASIVNVEQSRWIAELQSSPRILTQRQQVAGLFGLTAHPKTSPTGLTAQRSLYTNNLPKKFANNGYENIPIQRRVVDFNSTTEHIKPPGSAILEAIDLDDFSDKQDVKSKLQGKDILYNPRKNKIKRPTRIKAEIRSDTKMARKLSNRGSFQSVIGNIGTDEFFIRTGNKSESFEGGHLVSHALWKEDSGAITDPANSYENLVPMSRTFNVNKWKPRENEAAELYENLTGGETLRWDIDIPTTTYHISQNALAKYLNLDLKTKAKAVEKQIGPIATWSPEEINSELQVEKTRSGRVVDSIIHSPTKDNPIRRISKISNALTLVNTLRDKGIWYYIDKQLRTKIKAIN